MDHDGHFVDNIADESVNVEKIVETQMMIETVRSAISRLNAEERDIIESELQTLCSNILENKIDAESRFISILFDICLFAGFYFSAMSDRVEPSGFCFEVFEKAFRMFANINLEVFVDVFTEGYKTDDCENYVRNCFYNLLAFELEKGIPFIERAKTVKDEDEIPDIDDWLSSEDYSHDTEKLSNKMKAKTSTAFLQRLAIKYWKSNNDPELKNHISKLKSIFDKKVKLTALLSLMQHRHDTCH